MSQIQLKTLTPIHIGSGVELQGNFEYVYFKDERKVAVVDAEKVLAILGEDKMPQWMACIEQNESLLPLLRQRSPKLRAADVAARHFPMRVETDKPIHAQIHSGNGQPMIPGSSLKGAIRTAAWSTWIFNHQDMVTNSYNLKNYQRKWSDETLAKKAFGNDPNHDIFRLLQVGDAAFETTEAFQTDVINQYQKARGKITEKTWAIKKEITQFVEAIPANQTTSFRLNFNELLSKRASHEFNQDQKLLKLEELFPLINEHTGYLIDDEITHWEKQDNPTALGDYMEQLERIQSIIQTCSAHECVLRLGWGSGFRFMTGDWHGKMNPEDYQELVRSLRPKHPTDLDYPKTTRFVAGGVPLGFVKLAILK